MDTHNSHATAPTCCIRGIACHAHRPVLPRARRHRAGVLLPGVLCRQGLAGWASRSLLSDPPCGGQSEHTAADTHTYTEVPLC